MKESNKHIIRTLSFDIQYNQEPDAFSFQKEITDFIKEELLPIAEEVFTEVSEKKTIRIQKLKLDLGDFLKENYQEECKSRFKKQLSDKIRLILNDFQPDDEGLPPEIILPEKTQWEEFKYFLQTGTYSWNSRFLKENREINDLFLSVYEYHAYELKKFIEENFTTDILLRMIRQVNEANRWKLLQLWIDTETTVTFLKSFYQDLIQIYSQKKILVNSLLDFKEQFWLFLFEKSAFKKTENVFTEYISFLSIKTGTDIHTIYSLFESAIFSGSTSASFPPDKRNDLLKNIRTEFPEFILGQKNKTLFKEEITNKNKTLDSVQRMDPENTQEEQERGLIMNPLDSFKDENLKSKKAAIVLFLRLLIHSEYTPEKSYTNLINSWIKELAKIDHSLVEEEIREIKKNQNGYQIIRILETFESEVKEYLWSCIDNKREYKEFRREKYFELFKSILEYGVHYTAYSNQIVLQKKVVNQINSDTLKYYENVELLYDYISHNKKLKKENWLFLKSQLPESERTKYAKVITKVEEIWQENVSKYHTETKAGDTIKQQIDLKLLSLVEKFSCLSLFLTEKRIPGYYIFSVTELLHSLIREEQTKFLKFITLLNPKEKKSLWKLLPEQLKEKIAETEKELGVTKREFSEAITEASISEGKIQKAKIEEDKASQDPEYTFKKISEGEPVYIDNSGLVLFHPYLPRFFKLLDLLDGRQFKDEHAAHKAAHMLQYLVNKIEQAEEHNMFLNKLLCGIDPETPLIREIELSEKDKTLGEELISGVIQNWPILKKTSNDNFRASFLMRAGRLILEPQGWKLRVEEKGYDILVEKIPWSIAMIMLPWMKKIIYVEWK